MNPLRGIYKYMKNNIIRTSGCLTFLLLAVVLIPKMAAASEVSGSMSTGIQSGVMDGVLKAAPNFSPLSGTYSAAQSVSLAASGATAICYTADGSMPTCGSASTCTAGTKFTSNIAVNSSATIKGVACYADNSSGPVGSATYVISIPSGGGGGGGGYVAISYCSNVVYDNWGACVGNVQYRNILSPSPINCTFTDEQKAGKSRSCTTISGGAGSAATSTVKRVLGEKIYAEGEVFRMPDGKMYIIINGGQVYIRNLEELRMYLAQIAAKAQGEPSYPEGTIIRKPDGKMYIVINGVQIYIRNIAELRMYAAKAAARAAKIRIYPNGTLIRRADMKIFVIINRQEYYIKNLIELRKYAGHRIIDIRD